MKIPLLDEIAALFSEELGDGLFKIVRSEYNEAAFGDSLVEIAAPTFSLRLVRERSVSLVFIAPASDREEWTPLRIGLAAATHFDVRPPTSPIDAEINTTEAAALVRANYAAIVRAFGDQWSETRPTVRRLEDEYSRACARWPGSAEASAYMAEMNRRADEALANPSEALQAALKHLGLDKSKT